jgi:hypothetical protein
MNSVTHLYQGLDGLLFRHANKYQTGFLNPVYIETYSFFYGENSNFQDGWGIDMVFFSVLYITISDIIDLRNTFTKIYISN